MDLLPHLALMAVLLTGSVEHSVHIDKPATDKDGRVGIRVHYSSGKIQHVYKNSPAKYAGIQPGDVVLEVDGRHNSCHQIHGMPGTLVHLKLARGEETFEMDVMRAERSELGFF